MAVILGRKGGGSGGGGGGAPSGPAGGSLGGTYPNPTLSAAKQAELDGKVPKSLFDANTVLAANTDDTPAAITMGASTFLARLAAGNIKAASVAEVLTLLDTPTNSQAVLKTLYDANTILSADTDNTPAALTMGASTMLARLAAGNIKAATPSEIRTLLSLVVGTDVWSGSAAARQWQARRFITGKYYDGGNSSGIRSIANASTGFLYGMPFYCPVATTFDRVGILINATPTINFRLGLYATSSTTGLPTTRITDYGEKVLVATGGGQEFTGLTINLSADTMYWLALAVSGTTSVYSFANTSGQPNLGFSTLGQADCDVRWFGTHVYGALPDPFPTVTADSTAGMPSIRLRAA